MNPDNFGHFAVGKIAFVPRRAVTSSDPPSAVTAKSIAMLPFADGPFMLRSALLNDCHRDPRYLSALEKAGFDESGMPR